MSAIQERTNQLVEVFSQFPEEEQKAILKALRKQLILAEARRLSQTVWVNDISDEEICEAVREVRKELYEARKNSH